MVDGCTWFTFTPPEVTIASATGLGPVTDTVKPFSISSSARRWALVTELAFSPAGISSRSSITGTMLWGTRPASIFSKSRLGFSPRSRRMRASSFSRSSAGFRSMDRRYCSRSQCRRWALADSTRGPGHAEVGEQQLAEIPELHLILPVQGRQLHIFQGQALHPATGIVPADQRHQGAAGRHDPVAQRPGPCGIRRRWSRWRDS